MRHARLSETRSICCKPHCKLHIQTSTTGSSHLRLTHLSKLYVDCWLAASMPSLLVGKGAYEQQPQTPHVCKMHYQTCICCAFHPSVHPNTPCTVQAPLPHTRIMLPLAYNCETAGFRNNPTHRPLASNGSLSQCRHVPCLGQIHANHFTVTSQVVR